MGGCNAGWQGGGSSMGGNISGNLTAPHIPYASASNTIADTNIQRIDAFTIRQIVSGGQGTWEFYNYNLNAQGMEWLTARGTEGAPAASQDNDQLFIQSAKGYDGAGFRSAVMVKAYADGAPTEGVAVPGRWEWSTWDADGTEHVGMKLDKDGVLSSEIQLYIKKTTRLTRQPLTPVSGNVSIDAAVSDFYSLVQTGDVTFLNPTNAQEGRKFLLRIQVNGSEIGFGDKYRFASGPTFDTTAGSYTYIGFMYNEAEDLWDAIGAPIGPFIP